MPKTYRIVLEITDEETGGRELLIDRRVLLDEASGFIAYERTDAAAYGTLPLLSELGTLQLLLVTSDRDNLSVRLNGQTDSGIRIDRGGLLLVVNGNLSTVTLASVQYNPGDSSTANVGVLVGGT